MIPPVMKTAVFTSPGRVEVREVPVPQMGERQVLVEVKACAICTWEQRFYKGSKPEDYPFRGGHEVSGLVAAKGAAALCDAEVGDPCSLEIMTRCGQCYYCRRGMDNLCEHASPGQAPGQTWGPAGMSEYVLAEDYMVYRVEPDCIISPERDFAAFALAEPVSCVARGIRRTPLQFGDTAVVQGAGIMGLLHLELLKRRGVRVIVAEPDADRRAFAVSLGAAAAFDPLSEDLAQTVTCMTGGRGAEAVFFTAGGVPALRAAMAALGKGGWLMLYGSVHPKGDMPIDPNDVHYRELVVTGTFSHDKESFREAVALMNLRQIDVAPFVTERVPLDQIDYAMQRAMSKDTYRVVLTF
jgi:threonine dehydrogenase-like Zn-dependent dehydrogenase